MNEETMAADQTPERVINRAMLADPPRTVRFTYQASDSTVSEREAEPYEIKNGTLFGHCLERDALRQFKLRRMSGLRIGKPFKPRHKISATL